MNYNEWLELLPPAIKNELPEEELKQRYNIEMRVPKTPKAVLDTITAVTKKVIDIT